MRQLTFSSGFLRIVFHHLCRLQYPADTGNGWSVKSWWVTLDVGAMATTEVALNPGDGVFGNMTRTGAGRWFIDSVNTRTGQHTGLTTPRSIVDRLRVQPWAYITAECYGCVDCSTYPTAPSYFKSMAFASDDGSKTAPSWVVNPQPDPNQFCHEGTVIVNATDAYIYFSGPPADAA